MRDSTFQEYVGIEKIIKRRKQNSSSLKVVTEINSIDDKHWYELLEEYSDASLFQTWAYGIHQVGGKNIEHLVFRKNGRVVAITQVRTIILPVVRRGIAYVYWGPVWHQINGDSDKETLKEVLQELNYEYVVKRKLMLRIVPCIWDDYKEQYDEVFNSAGMKINPNKKKEQTIILDLAMSKEELKKQFRSNWRRNLNGSEKNNVEILEGDSDELILMFKGLYSELLTMKILPFPTDINKFRNIQRMLPERFKMRVFICTYEGKPVAGLITTAGKELGLLLLSATNNDGKKLQATTLLHWKVITWLKEKGCRWYDLGGIDAQANPGCFRFKSGMGGKIVSYIGQYESCRSMFSRILINTGEYMQTLKQKMRDFLSFKAIDI